MQQFKNFTIVEAVMVRRTKELVKGCTLGQESGGNCSVSERLHSAFITCGGIWQRQSELQLLKGKRRENNEFPIDQDIVSRYCVFTITETMYIAIDHDFLFSNYQINSIIHD